MSAAALLLGIILAIIIASRPAEKLLFSATLKIVIALLCSIFAAYQPVVQVRIREQKVLRYAQAWFVESAHGDGDAQAAGEARRFVDCAYGVGIGSGSSVLSAFE